MEDKQLSIMEGCHWVYCLLACLETPVDPDVHADLRRIARVLIDYRAQMVCNILFQLSLTYKFVFKVPLFVLK